MSTNLKALSPVIPETDFPEELLALKNHRWERFCEVCEKGDLLFQKDPKTIDAAKNVFVFSEFVAKRCEQNPDMFFDLIENGDLNRAYHISEYENKITSQCGHVQDIEELSVVIRKIRTREMVRIAFRELAGWADLKESMNAITELADACIDASLSLLYKWQQEEYGTPVGINGAQNHLVVFGFGKQGGHELNFSSDVDLMFAFPEKGQTEGGKSPTSNEEFFVRLCRRLIDVIGRNTTDGFVFRVDTRLRPYGDSGPIVMSFDTMESYYQEQGREWERYALIKARVVAGDKEKGNELLEQLKPFVYRRYLDYGTFESLRGMKQKIEQEVTRKKMVGNIKLGSGGIREIEFFGQIFQLLRGGVNKEYQEPGILKILQVLKADDTIPESVFLELTEAYIFLRYVENRLQMSNDRQTHSLPEDSLSRSRLSYSMGFDSWDGFLSVLNFHMDKVHGHFQALLAMEDSEDPGDEKMGMIIKVWHNLSEIETNLGLLKKIGFNQQEEVLAVLKNFVDITRSTDVSLQGRKRIDRLVPYIVKETVSAENPELVLKRIFELVNAVRGRSCYVSLMLENTDILIHLVKLAGHSPWIISFLSKHPLLLDELLDPRTLYAPLNKDDLKRELDHRFNRLPETDLESLMDDIRIFKQINTLRICAADVDGLLPLMKVSDSLTYLAETILDRILDISWEHMTAKYGLPSGNFSSDRKGFGIIAYGKLGGYELGYGSDLDLVFLHTGENGYTAGGDMAAIDNSQFYVRLGQRVIHFLTAMTQTGKLYETDMRLRPSGNAGILVTHIKSFEEYQKHQAWTWEHQALIKARAVSGDIEVGKRFTQLRAEIISAVRKQDDLRKAVADMRKKMKAEHLEPGSKKFSVKHSPGGIIDIEFLIQFLILLNGNRYSELVEWTDVVRQLNSLALADIIDDRTAYVLKQAYLVFRFYIHRLNLQEKPSELPGDKFLDIRNQVINIWNRYLY